MQREYIHYRSPDVAGLYYPNEGVYFENLDCKDGKVIIMVPLTEGGARNEQGRVKTVHHADG